MSLIFCVLLLLTACNSGDPEYEYISSDAPASDGADALPPAPADAPGIRLNQLGFDPQRSKVALVVGAANTVTTFVVISEADGSAVFTGDLATARLWSESGEEVRLADFSAFTTAGRYRVSVEGLQNSAPFEVRDGVLQDAGRALVQAYYFQRASTEILAQHAGDWARPAGHPDTKVQIHPSAAGPVKTASDVIASPGGWYDAGDYGKYIVSSAFAVHALLALYEYAPAAVEALALNIPEAGGALPDLLDEVRWNLVWMLTMQDPDDGGVYHKLVTPAWPATIMPAADVQPRYVVRKTTPAALTFAASMAQAARVYKTLDPDFAAQAQAAAVRAWQWAAANPGVRAEDYGVPTVSGGPYDSAIEGGSQSYQSEHLWAALELYVTTADAAYLQAARDHGFDALPTPLRTPTWSEVTALGLYALAAAPASANLDPDAQQTALASILGGAAHLLALREASGARVGLGPEHFVWGSNGVAASAGMMLVIASQLDPEKNPNYLPAALDIADYLLGRNGTGYSYITGFGTLSPMQPHHRPSAADVVAAPVPGWLVGGPNPGRQDNCPGYMGTTLAASWLDDWCSYASNEVAINWNAPAAFLLLSLEAAP